MYRAACWKLPWWATRRKLRKELLGVPRPSRSVGGCAQRLAAASSSAKTLIFFKINHRARENRARHCVG